jgi:hypothetical protein
LLENPKIGRLVLVFPRLVITIYKKCNSRIGPSKVDTSTLKPERLNIS